MPPDCDRLGYRGLVPLLCGGEGLSIQTLSLGLPMTARWLPLARGSWAWRSRSVQPGPPWICLGFV